MYVHTPLSRELESSIFPPVGVAEAAEPTVFVDGSPLEPSRGNNTVAALTTFLPVLTNRDSLSVWNGCGNDTGRCSLAWWWEGITL